MDRQASYVAALGAKSMLKDAFIARTAVTVALVDSMCLCKHLPAFIAQNLWLLVHEALQ